MPLRPILPGQLVQVPPTISGVLNLKGSTNCSANPNYPSATKGDMYYVSVAGKIGGASGVVVGVGDSYTASADNAGGTQASVGTSWFVLAHNEPTWGDIVGTLSDQTDLQSALDAKLTTSGSNLTSIATREFKDLQFDLPSTSSVTLSDPTKTLMLGASAVPSDISSTMPGAQLLIKGVTGDTHYPFAVIGDYRNGVSGERYSTYVSQGGAAIFSSAYMALTGTGSGASISGGYMLNLQADVPTNLLLSNDITNDANGGRLIAGFGNKNGGGTWPHVFDVSSQGTVTISNPYGQTGGVQYDRPQIVLSDVGTDYSSPSLTYGSLHQKSGHLYIGGYTGSGGSGNERKELDITSSLVSVNGAISATPAGSNINTGIGFASLGSGIAVVDFGNAVSSDASYGAHAAIYSDSNYTVVNSKTGANPLYLNFDNSNSSATVNLFASNAVFTQAGKLTLSGGLSGTTTNNNATSGNVGEYVSASVVQGSATALTTATPKTVTSISLTAGDWDVTGIGCITGASTGTEFDVAIGTTTNSLTGTVLGDTRAQTPTVSLAGADATLMIPSVRVSLSGTTTYYLIAQETFTLGSPAAYGRISARRVR